MVAVSGNRAIVGHPQAKRAFVFHRDGANWIYQATLTADGQYPPVWEGYFGISASIDGDWAIIGDHGDNNGNTNGTGHGSAHVFHWNGASWNWFQKLTVMPPYQDIPEARFGYSVSISGDKALIGAFGNDEFGNNAGAAYAFHWDEGASSWTQQAKITPSEEQTNSWFGWNVSISGDEAIIGAPFQTYEDNGSTYSAAGVTYLFHWDDVQSIWSERSRVLPNDDDNRAHDRFGHGVAISGNRAVATAYQNDNSNGTKAGAAYPFLLESTGSAPELAVASPAPVCPNQLFDLSTLAVTDANNIGAVLTWEIIRFPFTFSRMKAL